MTIVEILLIALVALWFAVIIWLEVSARQKSGGELEAQAPEAAKEITPETPAAAPEKETEMPEEEKAAHEDAPDILCQFVFNGKGEKVGETIAFDGDLVIIKAKEKYYAVPLKHVETKDGRLTVMGVTDWTIAEQLAEKWKDRSSKLT